MSELRIAHPTRTNTGETRKPDQEARYSRGVALATNFFHEIRKVSDAKGLYTVPSSKPSEAYLVTVWPVAQCSCPDFNRRMRGAAPCKHIHAVRYLVKKSAACEGCGVRHWNRDLTATCDSLAHFDGDLLCPVCLAGSDGTPC